MDASGRYDAALEVVRDTSDEGTRKLIAMLGDDECVMTSEGMSVYDVEPTYDTVGGLAVRELASRNERAWPVLVDALPGASKDKARSLLSVLWQLRFETRMALPDDVHAKIEEAARTHGYPGEGDRAGWDRDFARRMRAGEFPTAESLWRARLMHPYSPERHAAIYRLRDIVEDKAAFLRELVPLLDDPDTCRAVLFVINDLPHALSPETVRMLASGSLVRKSELLLGYLAEYGEPARARISPCPRMRPGQAPPQGEAGGRRRADDPGLRHRTVRRSFELRPPPPEGSSRPSVRRISDRLHRAVYRRHLSWRIRCTRGAAGGGPQRHRTDRRRIAVPVAPRSRARNSGLNRASVACLRWPPECQRRAGWGAPFGSWWAITDLNR